MTILSESELRSQERNGLNVGVLLGAGITLGYTKYTNIVFSIPLLQVLGAILLALLIGALSGVYPAIKASKIQPAEAVRK